MSGEDDGLRRFALDARARLKPLDVWLSESPRTPSDVRAYFVFAAEIEAILAGERPARLADRHGNTASYGCAARMTASAFRRGVSEGAGVSKVDGQ